MAGSLLLGTGALVSLLDRDQRDHGPCIRFFETWSGPVLSTEAVFTEATHLLGRTRGGRPACIDFFLAGGAALVPATPGSLRRARKLIEQYASLPMDDADATLVALAEEAVPISCSRRTAGTSPCTGSVAAGAGSFPTELLTSPHR